MASKEDGVSGSAAIEAEGELDRMGLQVLLAQAVVEAQHPRFQVAEDADGSTA